MDSKEFNNQACVTGTVCTPPLFTHSDYHQNFYTMEVLTSRLSHRQDHIWVMISDRTADVQRDYTGLRVRAEGQYRSFNKHSNGRSRLQLSIYACSFDVLSVQEPDYDENRIYLNGFICRKPYYRTTRSGSAITDVMLAVNRSYRKSDYIPCIFWNKNADFVGRCRVGEHLKIWGRIQSRVFQKQLENYLSETHMVNEISVNRLEWLGIDENCIDRSVEIC